VWELAAIRVLAVRGIKPYERTGEEHRRLKEGSETIMVIKIINFYWFVWLLR
jgi:hypothetical protein